MKTVDKVFHPARENHKKREDSYGIMRKVLTIIVPSYNVEQFLDQTLESFIDERVMKDIEVLVVNDGSKDRTAEIAQKYADRYPDTFYVISKENGGHGSAINCGIAEAQGKYFKVVDGDDWVSTDGLVELVERLRDCRADYVFTNYYEVNDSTKEKRKVYFPDIPSNIVFSFGKIAKETGISMHALVIRTDILQKNQIYIDEHSFYVDVEYILYPVPYIRSIIYYDIFVYMYRFAQTEQSVSIKGYQKNIQDHLRVILHILDYIHQYKGREDAEKAKIYYMEKRLAKMIDSQVSIFTSFSPFDREIRQQFKEFDRVIKKKNKHVYHLSEEYSGTLRMLRMIRFHGYSLFVILSRFRNRKEQ